MKTERRHELQTNELAVWLTKWIEKVKPYSKGFIGVLIIAGVVGLASYMVNSRQAASRSEAWTEYFVASGTGDAEKFREVGETYAGTTAAMWALQSAGDNALVFGARQLFRDRDAANEQLETARDAFQKVVDQVDGVQMTAEAREMLKQRALFGLGQALESLGEFTEAEQQYQRIVDEFSADAVAVGLAERRLDALKQQSTREWYAWLAQQKPAENPIGTPGLFDSLPELPDKADLNLPKPGQLLTPETGATPPSGDVLLQPSDTTGDDNSGLPLFGPDTSGNESSPQLFELPADSTDETPTDDASTDQDSDVPAVDETPTDDSEAVEQDQSSSEDPVEDADGS